MSADDELIARAEPAARTATVASVLPDGRVMARIPSLDGGRLRHGPCGWPSPATPTRGQACAVIRDDKGQLWALPATGGDLSALPAAVDALEETIDELTGALEEAQGRLDALEDTGGSVTPALTNITLGGTGAANVQRWSRVGRIVHVDGGFTLGAGGAFTGVPSVALPVAPDHSNIGVASGVDASASQRNMGQCAISGSSLFFALPLAVNATSPWTWAAGDSITYQITYQAAE